MILPILSLCGVSFVISLARHVPRPPSRDPRRASSTSPATARSTASRSRWAAASRSSSRSPCRWLAALVCIALGVDPRGRSRPAEARGSHATIDRRCVGGVKQQTPLALSFLGGCLALHLMGLWDDRKAMGPYSKLFVQLARRRRRSSLFNPALRAVTALGTVPSIVLTVLWITAITNAFNFLDNMDGLSAGVACVCAAAFLVTALSIGQWFVAASLALLLGALLGFLCFNFPPASIFMGDSGSLVIGFMLGVLTIRTTVPARRRGLRRRVVRGVRAGDRAGGAAVRPDRGEPDPHQPGQEPVRGRHEPLQPPPRRPRHEQADGRAVPLPDHRRDGGRRRSSCRTRSRRSSRC